MYRLHKDHVVFLCTTLKIIFVHFAQKPNKVFVQYAENYFCIKWRILGFKQDNVCAIFPIDKLLRMCYYWNSGLTSRRRPEVWWIASLHFMYFSQIKPKERMKTFDGGGVFQEKFYLILIKWFALHKTLTKSFLNSNLRLWSHFRFWIYDISYLKASTKSFLNSIYICII